MSKKIVSPCISIVKQIQLQDYVTVAQELMVKKKCGKMKIQLINGKMKILKLSLVG